MIAATDADLGDNALISYTVISDWANDVFSLNPQTGVFTLTARLDYEEVSTVLTVAPVWPSAWGQGNLERVHTPSQRRRSLRVLELMFHNARKYIYIYATRHERRPGGMCWLCHNIKQSNHLSTCGRAAVSHMVRERGRGREREHSPAIAQ